MLFWGNNCPLSHILFSSSDANYSSIKHSNTTFSHAPLMAFMEDMLTFVSQNDAHFQTLQQWKSVKAKTNGIISQMMQQLAEHCILIVADRMEKIISFKAGAKKNSKYWNFKWLCIPVFHMHHRHHGCNYYLLHELYAWLHVQISTATVTM